MGGGVGPTIPGPTTMIMRTTTKARGTTLVEKEVGVGGGEGVGMVGGWVGGAVVKVSAVVGGPKGISRHSITTFTVLEAPAAAAPTSSAPMWDREEGRLDVVPSNGVGGRGGVPVHFLVTRDRGHGLRGRVLGWGRWEREHCVVLVVVMMWA